MADAAWKIIEEVEAMGGMTKAVDSGWAKLKIEAAPPKSRPASTRARTSSWASTSTSWQEGRPDRHPGCGQRQGARRPDRAPAADPRQPRRRAKVQQALALDALTASRKGHGNLLDLSIKAMRLRATVGEVSATRWKKSLAATAPIRKR
jgi:methylmalonyl-CoA mutase